MTSSTTELPLTSSPLALGDLVRLPDGRTLSVRAVMLELPHSVGSMHGFALCGEVGPSAALLSLPSDPSGPVSVYRPVDRVPAHAVDATMVCSGQVPYWAPHLPGLRGAMGSLGYKVCVVRGAVEPLVLIWRGRELVVFVHSAILSASDVTVRPMRRDESAINSPVTRSAAAVAAPDRLGSADSASELYKRFVQHG